MENIEKKLDNLLKLQEIDSKIFELKQVRGALPDEIEDLEDVLVGYNKRLEKFNDDIENKTKDIENLKNKTNEAIQSKTKQHEEKRQNDSTKAQECLVGWPEPPARRFASPCGGAFFHFPLRASSK